MHGNLRPLTDDRPDASGPPPTAGPEPEGNEVAALLRLIWRRRALIVLVTLLATAAISAVVWRLPASYRAEAVLLFAPPGDRADPTATGRPAERPGDLRNLASQIELIRSRDLLAQVVQDAGLLYDPGFNPVLGRAPGPLERLGLRAPPPAEALRLSAQRAATLAALRGRLEVRPIGRARALSVAVDAPTAAGAARVANAVAQVYLASAAERARADRKAATAWLDRRVEELRQRVQAAEAAVADYRIESGLADRGPDSAAARQRAVELNRALVEARTAAATARARLEQVRSGAPAPAGDAAAAPSAAPAPRPLAVAGRTRGRDAPATPPPAPASGENAGLESLGSQVLRQEQARLESRRAELATRYGPRHPRLRAAVAELRDLRRRIADERARALARLEREAALAEQRERALRADLRQLNAETGSLGRAQVELAQLEREAAAERALFDTFLARLKATRLSAGSPGSRAELITRAHPPSQPAAPNRPLLAGFGALAAAAAAVALAFLREALDRGVRGPEQLERTAGLRTLATVPKVPRKPVARVIAQPAGAFAESLRGLYTALLLADVDRPPRSLLVTSALPGEGKTALVCALARVVARAGRRVLVIDADLRYPRVAAQLHLPGVPGLSDLLTGQASLPEALQPDRTPALDGRLAVLPAGRAADPGGLLDSEALGRLLAEVSPRYDLVIVDAPPVLTVADPRALAARVDTTLLAVRWSRTPRERVARAASLLRDAGAHLAGAALVQVDARHHAREASGYGVGLNRRRYYAGA